MRKARRARRVGLTRPAFCLKEAIDRPLAALTLLVLSPILLGVALAIKVDTRGPVFYRQQRVGRDGEVFRVFKFRTMIDGADRIGLGKNVARNDRRITRVGAILRRTSIDEVPQLINVALGQMALVGPRPSTVEHAGLYTAHQRRRLEVRPGITGWAQVNGRNLLSWEERIERDIWYIDHWTPALDLRIAARTPRVLLSSEGLYGAGGVTTDLGAGADSTAPG